MHKAIECVVFRVDGSFEAASVKLEENQDFFTGFAYKTIGAQMVEMVRLTNHDNILLIDEEGKLTGKKININATLLASPFLGPGDAIVGDAILMRFQDLE